MNLLEIFEAVQSRPEVIALKPDTHAIAAALSVGRKKFVPTEIGNGTILEVLGLAKGNALMDLINSDPNFRHVKPLVEQGRLRLDSALVKGTLMSLVPALLSLVEVEALFDRSKVPDPISEFDVRKALIQDSGDWRV